ncbi:MAG: serine/threonine-protein kinase, partial [Planctomycetota bacterium]
LARDLELGREVAVKVLHSVNAADERLRKRFRKESRLLASLQHPNIVSVHETGSDGDEHFIVMDRVQGVALSDALRELRERKQAGSASWQWGRELREIIGVSVPSGREDLIDEGNWIRTAVKLAYHTAGGIEAAHSENVVHRDLKPANVMLTGGGHPVVLDFGLGGIVGAEASLVTRGFFGSVAYLAPEQVQSREIGADYRTDVYQLGLLLYELITLERAFPQETIASVLMRVSKGEIPDPRTRNPEIPRSLERICLRALRRDPLERYVSVSSFRNDLSRFLKSADARRSSEDFAGASTQSSEHTRLDNSYYGESDRFANSVDAERLRSLLRVPRDLVSRVILPVLMAFVVIARRGIRRVRTILRAATRRARGGLERTRVAASHHVPRAQRRARRAGRWGAGFVQRSARGTLSGIRYVALRAYRGLRYVAVPAYRGIRYVAVRAFRGVRFILRGVFRVLAFLVRIVKRAVQGVVRLVRSVGRGIGRTFRSLRGGAPVAIAIALLVTWVIAALVVVTAASDGRDRGVATHVVREDFGLAWRGSMPIFASPTHRFEWLRVDSYSIDRAISYARRTYGDERLNSGELRWKVEFENNLRDVVQRIARRDRKGRVSLEVRSLDERRRQRGGRALLRVSPDDWRVARADLLPTERVEPHSTKLLIQHPHTDQVQVLEYEWETSTSR